MKHPFRSHILPFFTLGAGGLGFALRLWLFSNLDEKGLLPAKHPANALLFLFSAVVLGILFLATRNLEFRSVNRKALRSVNAIACVLGGLGLILSVKVSMGSNTSSLTVPALVLNLAGGLILFFMAFLKVSGKKLPYWLPAALTVVLMVTTITQCQVWGAEPQLQAYFFPLMASVFLILTAYQETAVLVRKSKRSLLAFFSQSAAFFCCLSFNSFHKVFYCGMFLWAALQIYACLPRKKEA